MNWKRLRNAVVISLIIIAICAIVVFVVTKMDIGYSLTSLIISTSIGFLSMVAAVYLDLEKKESRKGDIIEGEFYSTAIVKKERDFNYLKYGLSDVDENTDLLNKYDAEEEVDIYIVRKK